MSLLVKTFMDLVKCGKIQALYDIVDRKADNSKLTVEDLKQAGSCPTMFTRDIAKQYDLSSSRKGAMYKKLRLTEEDMKSFLNVIQTSLEKWENAADDERKHFFRSRLLVALSMLDVPRPASTMFTWSRNALMQTGTAKVDNLQSQWRAIMVKKHHMDSTAMQQENMTKLVGLLPDPESLLVQHTPAELPKPAENGALQLLSECIVHIYRQLQQTVLIDTMRVLQWLTMTTEKYLPAAETEKLSKLIPTGHNYHVSPLLTRIATRLNVNLAGIHLPTGELYWGVVPAIHSEQGQFQDEFDNPIAPILDPWLERICVMFTYTDQSIGLISVRDTEVQMLQSMQSWMAHLLVSVPEETTYPGFRANVLFPLALYHRTFSRQNRSLEQFQQAFKTMFYDNDKVPPVLSSSEWIQIQSNESMLLNYSALFNSLLALAVPNDANYWTDAGTWLQKNLNKGIKISLYQDLIKDQTTQLTLAQIFDTVKKVETDSGVKLENSSASSLVGYAVYNLDTGVVNDMFTWPPLSNWRNQLGFTSSTFKGTYSNYLDFLFTSEIPLGSIMEKDAQLEAFKIFIQGTTTSTTTIDAEVENVENMYKDTTTPQIWKCRHVLNDAMIGIYINKPNHDTVKKFFGKWLETIS